MTPDAILIRPITAGELDWFAAIGATPEAAGRMRNFLDEIVALGESEPAWCFAAIDGHAPVARVVYVRLNVASGDFVLNGLVLPWDASPVAVGRVLLARSRALMGEAVTALNLAIWSDDPRAEVKTALMDALAWPLAQDRQRYERAPEAAIAPERLAFRSARDVGEGAFIRAIAEVTAGTLDAALANDAKRLGLKTAAARHWEDLVHLDDARDRFELAYDAEGALVGLIVPQVFGAKGLVGYIGVVPGQRGRGYARDLLRRAVAVLSPLPGLEGIVADIDVANRPMAEALMATGFVPTRGEKRYRAP